MGISKKLHNFALQSIMISKCNSIVMILNTLFKKIVLKLLEAGFISVPFDDEESTEKFFDWLYSDK